MSPVNDVVSLGPPWRPIAAGETHPPSRITSALRVCGGKVRIDCGLPSRGQPVGVDQQTDEFRSHKVGRCGRLGLGLARAVGDTDRCLIRVKSRSASTPAATIAGRPWVWCPHGASYGPVGRDRTVRVAQGERLLSPLAVIHRCWKFPIRGIGSMIGDECIGPLLRCRWAGADHWTIRLITNGTP